MTIQSMFLAKYGQIFVLASIFGSLILNTYLITEGIMLLRYAPFLCMVIVLSVALPVTLFGSAYGWGLQEMFKQLKAKDREEFNRAVEATMPLPLLIINKKINERLEKKKRRKK